MYAHYRVDPSMAYETIDTAGDETEAALPEATAETGEQEWPSEEYWRKTFGISSEEAQIPVQYQDYKGTFGQMLIEPGCPVGADFKAVHEEGGREAVVERLEGYRIFFGVKLGEDGKLNPKELPKELPPVDETKKKQL